MKRTTFIAVLTVIGLGSAAQAYAASCESVATLNRPNTKVTSATEVAAGAFVPPGGGQARGGGPNTAFASLPAFCRVAATLTPSSDSDIKIEVWLPTSGWNGKYQAVGNGAWQGSIGYAAMAEALRRGYATSRAPPPAGRRDTGRRSCSGRAQREDRRAAQRCGH